LIQNLASTTNQFIAWIPDWQKVLYLLLNSINYVQLILLYTYKTGHQKRRNVTSLDPKTSQTLIESYV
jgi:hypothetical protein